jgi:cytoskeleton protein RodZ
MFEIGSSLREARERRGLELDAVQRALRIRRRYLEALESDRFDQLPGEVYARGFLREYAEYLGLDGSIYVEEYNARFAPREEHTIAMQPAASRLGRRPVPRLLMPAALGALVLAGALAAWRLGGGNGNPSSSPPASVPQTTAAAATHAHSRTVPPTVRKHSAMLKLTAARGDCWLGIRVGSSSGRTIYWQTLPQGKTIRFGLKQPLWVRFGDGQNVDATVAGKPLAGVPRVTGELMVRA